MDELTTWQLSAGIFFAAFLVESYAWWMATRVARKLRDTIALQNETIEAKDEIIEQQRRDLRALRYEG